VGCLSVQTLGECTSAIPCLGCVCLLTAASTTLSLQLQLVGVNMLHPLP
jgi:hypothetical protein